MNFGILLSLMHILISPAFSFLNAPNYEIPRYLVSKGYAYVYRITSNPMLFVFVTAHIIEVSHAFPFNMLSLRHSLLPKFPFYGAGTRWGRNPLLNSVQAFEALSSVERQTGHTASVVCVLYLFYYISLSPVNCFTYLLA